ncbi:MAG TPA: FAD-binding oxidoreductase [Candidatus Binataceae bacterium]|nr:FAD-binding oxidoreductase [Candidatus Binataceae bacterium]
MDVRRNQWGESPWLHESLELEPPAALFASPDVIVVGAGFTGTSAAYHLAKLGVRTLVLEAETVADGASGRTGGLVLEGTATGPRPGVEACVPKLRRLVDEEGIDCELDLPGCWEIEHRENAAAQMLPWADGGKRVAIARTVTGGTVEPARLNIGLARAALRAGAAIRENARVTRIEYESRPAVYIDNECLHADWVIVGINAWMRSLVSQSPSARSSLTFAVATEQLKDSVIDEIGLGDVIPFYTADLPYLWGRTMRDGRVIFGAGLLFAAPDELEQVGTDHREFANIISALHDRIRRLHPALSMVELSASWAGPIVFTEGAVPIIGSVPSCPRVLVAGAYAGHGVALSVRAGEVLANSIVHGEPLPAWGELTR